jgi:GT2 family glycosyltransferase/glycosyltransferase involved in cell wall biosynthesis
VTSTVGRAVVVVNYGSHRLLAEGLAGLADQSIVIVDNFSTAEERAAITRLAGERGWDLVALPDNRGFGHGVNAGVRRAIELGAATVILLNPDAVLTPEVADALHRHCAEHPADLVTPRIVDTAGAPYFSGAFVELRTGAISGWRREPGDGPVVLPSPAGRQPWLTAACLALSTDLWQRAGGMAEDYFLYWEDVDFSVRCVRTGARLVVRDDLVAVHDEGGTHPTVAGDGPRGPAKSDLYYRYNCRNRLLFAARLLPRARLRWALASPRQSWQIYLRGGRRQLLAGPSGLFAAIRGTLSGLGLLVRRQALADSSSGPPPSTGSGRRFDRLRERTSSPTSPTLPEPTLSFPEPTPSLPEPVEGQDTSSPGPAEGPRVLLAHPSADLYGSDRMLIESAEGFRADGWSVAVVLPYPGPLQRELAERGFIVLTCGLPALRKAIFNPIGLIGFMINAVRHAGSAVRLIRRYGTDLVYVSTIVTPLWLALGRLTGRRVICHIHEAERRMRRPLRRLLNAPVGLAHRVIANSRVTAEVLAGTLPAVRPRTEVIVNGVEYGPTSPPRSQLSGRIRLIFTGRLSPRKGPQTAVAAVEELTGRGLDVELDLVGSVVPGHESFEHELRRLAAPLGDRVRFHGFTDGTADLITAADIALVPSIGDESYGNVAVEAAAIGRPLVISSQAGLVEAVGDLSSVRVVAPDRPVDLADAIADTIADWHRSAAAAFAATEPVRRAHAPGRYRDDLTAAARSTIR